MSLDQCACGHKGIEYTNEFGESEYPDELYLAEWIGHPNLHGFMENVYGGKDINGVRVELTIEDIDALEQTINESDLPKTEGFFFGGDADEHYYEEDSKFIVDARSAIKDGYSIYYYSNW